MHGCRHSQQQSVSTTLETIMSMTGNENPNTPAPPLPADDGKGASNSEPVQESELTSTPVPNTTTNPTIKNN